MTWQWVCLILGIVWWFPAIIVCGVLVNKQKTAAEAVNKAVEAFVAGQQ